MVSHFWRVQAGPQKRRSTVTNSRAQETEIRAGADLRELGGAKFGKVEAISLDDRTVDIKKRQDTAGRHPLAVYAHKIIDTKVLAEALIRLGEYVADNGLAGEGHFYAARDLLQLAAPRIGTEAVRNPEEATLLAALRIAPHLDHTVLPIQGPPGAGKTHTGARMICTLVKDNKKVGVTANSHKVIRNLLDEVLKAAPECGVSIQCIEEVTDKEPSLPGIDITTDKAEVLSSIGSACQVAAGTAWFWARPDAFEAVDVLFVDEAAQMSLANVLAVSQAAKSIVLLGDPRQLEQPMQGSHPEGTGLSALDHILGIHATVPADRGLFLEETWRLHPQICAFTSEMFYDDRLRSRPGLDQQRINSTGRVTGSGLRYLPVTHEGNQSSSPEEADQIRDLVADIMKAAPTWINREGVEAALGLDDILIIAPYNAQVFALQERIPGARIGTVDKFQGQEAPIVIYSMTTSSHADAPRGMEFLYSPNRFNVATSRAKCVCILVEFAACFRGGVPNTQTNAAGKRILSLPGDSRCHLGRRRDRAILPKSSTRQAGRTMTMNGPLLAQDSTAPLAWDSRSRVPRRRRLLLTVLWAPLLPVSGCRMVSPDDLSIGLFESESVAGSAVTG